MTRRYVFMSALLLGAVVADRAAAQEPAGARPPAGIAAADDPLALTARELNRHGVAMLDAGDTPRALEYFMRSRAVLPSAKNTTNAAICLERMGRYDEALELFEELLLKHKTGLDEEDRRTIEPAMAALRQKVGSLDVSSNVAGAAVIVDGRERGKLPLSNPVRVLGGKRLVRVIKSGYPTFERSVEVPLEKTVTVDARLEALQGVGQLVIEDGAHPGSEVWVNRVKVGKTPWEGSLPPGEHVVWTVKGAVGSAPRSVTVLQGQTALARLESKTLGPEVRIRAEPRTARIEIDGVRLGVGAWSGRLPAGTYTVAVSEPGYRTKTTQLSQPAAGAPADVPLALPIDASHPRWPARETGHVWADLFGGYAGGATFASDAESKCPAQCGGDDPSVNGFMAGIRGGYRFPFGLSFELGGGYMSLASSVSRTEQDTSGGGSVPVTYRFDDDITVRGPFGSLGVSHRIALGKRYNVFVRTTVGLLFANVMDPLTGTAATTGEAVPVVDEDRNQELNAAAVFVVPELGAGVRLGPFDLGASLGVAFFATDGPEFTRDNMGPQNADGFDDEDAVQNAQLTDVIAKERAYGRFVLWTPRVSIGRTF